MGASTLVSPLASGSVAGKGVAVVTWVQVAIVSVIRSFVTTGIAVPTSLFLEGLSAHFPLCDSLRHAYQIEVTTLLASTMTDERTWPSTETLVAVGVAAAAAMSARGPNQGKMLYMGSGAVVVAAVT